MLVKQVEVAEPPPSYQAVDERQDEERIYNPAKALEKVEKRMVQVNLSEVDISSSSHSTIRGQPTINPPLKLIEVQEKVRCLAINKKERRDARRAERALKWEAWKERKQAKRTARAAWREERHALRA